MRGGGFNIGLMRDQTELNYTVPKHGDDEDIYIINIQYPYPSVALFQPFVYCVVAHITLRLDYSQG